MSTARLIVSQPGRRARSVEVGARAVSIGRRADNAVCLEGDPKVSKYHAVIEPRDGEYWVADLGSSNGTTVNGEPVTSELRLRDGDHICLGGASTLEFHQPEEQPPAGARSFPGLSASGFAPPAKLGSASSDAAVPSVPGVPGVPTVPGVPSAPQPPAAAQSVLGLPRAAAVAAAAVVAVVGLVGALWAAGVVGTPGAKRPKREREAVNAAPAGGVAEKPGGAGEALPPVAVDDSGGGVVPTPVRGGPAAADANMARTLAVQISQRSFYNFDPNFVALINSYVNEYRAAAGYFERAGRFREAIDSEFVNAQGIQPPLIAYVIALSQSKFADKGGGVWNLPPAIVKSYSTGATPPDMADPAASTRVAAAYLRSLLDLFERDNFMYAVACYGMTLDEAGKVRVALESKDPGGQGRYDFWKMKNAGVVQGAQVERVARFFAAGIVAENPRQFGLKEQPLSSLY